MWALVTGGSKRLGAALCVSLAEKGYSIAVHYRDSQKEALEVVKKCRGFNVQAVAIYGDFSSIPGLMDFKESVFKHVPDISLLINNVGEYLPHSALETSVEQWISLFQVNLHAPFFLSERLAERLIKQHGQIINIGVCGLMRQKAHTYATAYRLAKQGLWGLTLALARELAPQGVRVNMVSPGQLDFSVDLPKDLSSLPMGRSATCGEVCRVVNFLIDPDNGYLTGQNIEVAGGLGLS